MDTEIGCAAACSHHAADSLQNAPRVVGVVD
jgi:hypothetical protein